MTGKNVIDWYKEYDDEFIISDLDQTRAPLMVATENVNGDFHKANILRSAEGFNLHSFAVVGNKKVDMRAAVGTQHRMKPNHFETLPEFIETVPQGYSIVTVDNVPGAISLTDHIWNPRSVLIFGEEQRGVSTEALDVADHVVYIPMRGAVRSFSVSTAAGIVMWDYISRSGA